jgi:hypothetical protein
MEIVGSTLKIPVLFEKKSVEEKKQEDLAKISLLQSAIDVSNAIIEITSDKGNQVDVEV